MMGLFDRIFGKPAIATVSPSSSRASSFSAQRRFSLSPDPHFDVERAHRLRDLFTVSGAARDNAWITLFWDAAWTAALQVTDPPVFTGPDGFPYLRLDIADADANAVEVNSLANIARSMIDQGIGVALFANSDDQDDAAQYVISMGVLDALVRFDNPRGEPAELAEIAIPTAPSDASVSNVGGAERTLTNRALQSFVGAPSDAYLSKPAARALFRHLTEGWGLANPRVSLLMVPALHPARSLVIGKSMADFRIEGVDEALMHDRVRMLAWYLPPSRRLMLMPDDWRLDDMTPLRDLI